MIGADRQVWRCDPDVHVEEETYEQLLVVRGYIENENDLSKSQTCEYECKHYWYTKKYGCYYGLCSHQRSCKGKILGCSFIDYNLNVCLSVRDERHLDMAKLVIF